jgi:hypothetical protein
MELSADPGQTLTTLTAEAGSPDDDALRMLASWSATHQPGEADVIRCTTAQPVRSIKGQRPRTTTSVS